MASIVSAGTTSGTSLNLSGDTSGVLQLATNGSTTAVTIDTSQRVGVGTASPSQPLTVRSSGTSTSAGGNIATRIESNGSGYAATLQFSDNVANSSYISMVGSATAFGQAGTERMRIDSSGNVGIGTSSPVAALTVVGDGNANFLAGYANSGDTYAQMVFYNNAGTNQNGQLGVEKVGTNGGLMYFKSKPDGGAVAERMRITSGGSVLVGTTADNGSTSNSLNVVAGKFSTVKNQSITLTQNTATTVFTVGDGAGIYSFSIFILASNIGAFSAYAVILYDGNEARILTNVAGGQVTIALSGLNVRVTQTFFSPSIAFTWGYHKQALT